jgi:pimeloyl-ACP methyl ester carboxylesterase
LIEPYRWMYRAYITVEETMVEPFKIAIPDGRLSAIRAKVQAYDWDELPDTGGWRSGVGLRDLRHLVDYWLERYDWRAAEERLNRLPQYVTKISGEQLHFIHRKGNGKKPPVLLLHGWPGSFLEFEQILGPLSEDGHDVIVPSLPGFAFSRPITGIIGPRRAAELMHHLMLDLFGETRYIVQGGDWGAAIGSWMAYKFPYACMGLHVNMVNVVTADAEPATEVERDFLRRHQELYDRESAYSHQQETRPQTLGVAMADSPVGIAAWILEKFGNWADLPRTTDGSPEIWATFAEDLMLTNLMLYIASGAVVTATWIYQGKRLEGGSIFPPGTHIDVPTGIAAFPDPVFPPPPRSLAQKTFNVVHWTEMKAGGHFASLEQPQAFLADLRAFIQAIL